jgi:polyhydroxyalkanoate synthesis regulator phasin
MVTKPAIAHTSPAGTGGAANGATGQQLTIMTAKGNPITLQPELNQPLSETIATLGANGTTTLLADQLESIAKQLMKEGEITKEQADSLIKLANQGHYMADIAGAVEKAAQLKDYANNMDFFNQQIEFEGKRMTVYQLSSVMGYSTPLDAYRYDAKTGIVYDKIPEDLLHPDYPSNPAIASFLDIYHTLEANGALADPTIQTVVASLASKITITNELLTQSMGDLFMGYSTATDQVVEMTAAKATHVNSAGICDVGSGTDSGVQCQ